MKAFIDAALADYRVCLVWQATNDDEPIPANIEWSDEALTESATDVADFVAANWSDVKTLDPGQVGHDFCLTRNGHGAGFWDRGLGELGDRLTRASKPYGTQDGYIGDNGLLYLHG